MFISIRVHVTSKRHNPRQVFRIAAEAADDWCAQHSQDDIRQVSVFVTDYVEFAFAQTKADPATDAIVLLSEIAETVPEEVAVCTAEELGQHVEKALETNFRQMRGLAEA